MATARLIPSASSVASGVTISSASNMYANIDSTTTATLTSTSKDTTARYAYIRGFNFDIPSDAIVTAFEVKIKGYESRLSTSSSYAPRLVNNTSVISGTTASENFGSSDTTITIPTGNLTWSQITGYGSDFGIRVTIKRSNKNQQGYLYIYGAEIYVTYQLPGESKLYLKEDDTWTEYSKMWQKVSGSWVEVSDPSTELDTTANYVKAN